MRSEGRRGVEGVVGDGEEVDGDEDEEGDQEGREVSLARQGDHRCCLTVALNARGE